ncbi:MAG: efflux RND transporter periplasmic adaptor subunit [Mizugakiibacter sp.]|uniref:efflux RND transporter periplasmic adaptor subunit n=1 Tax=Mizugakiibacter sp. TaxID=1972610 RepID=UPI0031C5A4C5|nr:efflux RND transporter periplasmic adaptor subunit [Xanthomonadaceae bacterium]
MRHAARCAALRRLLPLAASALLAACGGAQQAPSPQAPPPLAMLTVQPQQARREQAWDGVVEAVHQATMSAQTAGRVVELPFDVNDYVPAGAVVVRFTDVEQQSAQRRAQAALAAAQATYDEAQASYQRTAEIYARKLVAKAQLDQALARRDAARAALQSAQAALREVGQQLDYTVVRAPYSGIVTKRHVQVGEAVQPGQPLISGVSLEELRVNVQVPQSAVDAIRRFNAADVLLDGGVHRVAAAKVTVFPYADPDTHTFSVRLDLPPQKTGLYPGMTVKAAFAVGEARRLLLPASALVQRSEVSGVYVIGADNAVSLRQVRLGHRYGDKVEVLAGLAAGEKVAADPGAAALFLAKQHAAEPAR